MKGITIAMWSGPRSLSTAMMRSFENRNDTYVIDEPFYAHFLDQTKLNHPGRDSVIQSQSTNWDEIVKLCLGKSPQSDKAVFYQKQMAHHNFQGFDISWIKKVKNCLLIRDPLYVIASYNKKFPLHDERQLGYLQQKKIMNFLKKVNGEYPIIIDAYDILNEPRSMLRILCNSLGIRFSEKMLSWPKGKRSSDGVWAPFWYGQVERTTTFVPFKKKDIKLSGSLLTVYKKSLDIYLEMHEKRLKHKTVL